MVKTYVTCLFALALTFCFVGCGGSAKPAPVSTPQQTTPKVTVFTGDSITQFWNENGNTLPVNGAIDAGVSGDTTTMILSRFQSGVLMQKPSVVLILGGTNDMLFQINSVQTGVANIETMVNMATTAGTSHIFVGTVPPVAMSICVPRLCLNGDDPNPRILAFNTALLQMVSKHADVTVLDYHAALSDSNGTALDGVTEDGVHPTPLGYSKMDSVVQAALNSMASK